MLFSGRPADPDLALKKFLLLYSGSGTIEYGNVQVVACCALGDPEGSALYPGPEGNCKPTPHAVASAADKILSDPATCRQQRSSGKYACSALNWLACRRKNRNSPAPACLTRPAQACMPHAFPKFTFLTLPSTASCPAAQPMQVLQRTPGRDLLQLKDITGPLADAELIVHLTITSTTATNPLRSFKLVPASGGICTGAPFVEVRFGRVFRMWALVDACATTSLMIG